MPITLGNDISKWQGDVNFDVFKNNTQFVIVKATEGNGYKDPKLDRNRTEARRVGLLLGFYHFARPDLGNTPEKEAQYFLDTVGELREGELLALDYECPNQKQSDVDWCKKWLDYVFEKTKIKPFIYLNQSQIYSFNWQNVIAGSYALWVARYTYNPLNNNFDASEFKTAAMQQWSNNQQVPGASGGIDGNVFFGDLATLKKYGKPAAPAPQPPTPPQVIEDPETRIKLGKIGEVEYGEKKLKEIREIIGSLQVNITAITGQVETANRKIEGAKNALNS